MKDPIVEEVREIRRRLFEKCGGDVERMLEILRSEHEHYMASHPKQNSAPTDSDLRNNAIEFEQELAQ